MTTPRPVRSAWLVARREIASKLRSKAFVVSTVLLFGLALVSIVWGGIASQTATRTTVAVTGATAHVVAGRADVTVTHAASAQDAIDLVRTGDAEVALVPKAQGDSPFDYVIVAKDAVPQAFVASLSQAPPVELLVRHPENAVLRYLVALGFGVVFLMAASLFGGTIAQSVVEEKQTRVVEVLLSAITTRTLLTGKVLGNTMLAMAQIVGFAAIAVLGLVGIGQTGVLGALGGPLVWFAVFFLLGFVLLASLFAAAAALVSRQEDVGAVTAPLTMLVLAPYILVILFNDNRTVLAVMSYVPFSAPVAMPLRIYLGVAQWWEPVLSLALLAATCYAAIRVGARIYRNSILRMGARVRLAEALRG